MCIRDREEGVPIDVLREVSILSRADHPNITKVHDIFTGPSTLCMAQDCHSTLCQRLGLLPLKRIAASGPAAPQHHGSPGALPVEDCRLWCGESLSSYLETLHPGGGHAVVQSSRDPSGTGAVQYTH
eukprot:1377444-Amphidinium_carterae.1